MISTLVTSLTSTTWVGLFQRQPSQASTTTSASSQRSLRHFRRQKVRITGTCNYGRLHWSPSCQISFKCEGQRQRKHARSIRRHNARTARVAVVSVWPTGDRNSRTVPAGGLPPNQFKPAAPRQSLCSRRGTTCSRNFTTCFPT